MKTRELSVKARYVLSALKCMSRERARAWQEAELYPPNSLLHDVRRRLVAKVVELDQAALGLALLLEEEEQDWVYQAYRGEAQRC